MADPARYDIYPKLDDTTGMTIALLDAERCSHGKWIKWADFEDYKAAQRRNKNAELIIQLGIEVAELRSIIADMEKEKNESSH